MERYEYDEATNQPDDKEFYRDSFGERITRDGETMPAEEDQAMPDEPIMDEDEMAKEDDGFHERLDQTDPSGDMDHAGGTATMDEPKTDFEDKSSEEPGLGDKIREKYNDLKGDDRR